MNSLLLRFATDETGVTAIGLIATFRGPMRSRPCYSRPPASRRSNTA